MWLCVLILDWESRRATTIPPNGRPPWRPASCRFLFLTLAFSLFFCRLAVCLTNCLTPASLSVAVVVLLNPLAASLPFRLPGFLFSSRRHLSVSPL